MNGRFLRSVMALVATLSLVLGSLAGSSLARQVATPDATPILEATPPASPQASPVALPEAAGPADLDVLFIGAHPDDEAFGLAAYGQWNEFAGVQVGVITITRGEGGGNAVGTEEGPALGLLREDEERRAVSVAGIERIYNLDKVDFYYTLSAPLTIGTWGYEETLERVVRVVRATTPEVIITMNPAPTPGNHGHHQVAARLAVDAFTAAADPTRFPAQVADEGFDAWAVSSIYQNGAAGEGATGPDCATSFTPVDASRTIFGVWQGTLSEINGGITWGEVAREGQRTYASQGWAVFPDAPTDPAEIPCNYFTLIDSRVPISANAESTTAMLENAVVEAADGLPLGTQFYLTTDTFDILAGQPFTVTAHAQAPEGVDVSDATIDIVAPEGWEVAEADAAFTIGDGGEISRTFTVTPASDAEPDTRHQIEGSLTIDGVTGMTVEPVRVVPAVSGALTPRPEISQFLEWTETSGVPQLTGLIGAFDSIAVGEERSFDVVVTNNSDEPQSGTVRLELPAGFETDSASQPYENLADGESTTVPFYITNTDTGLATSNEGGEVGTYGVTISTESGSGTSTSQAGLNLVPSTVVPKAAGEVTVDGVVADGEYGGEPLDLNRVWEGEPPADAADASGTGWVTWNDEGLYVAVQVTDETLGTVLTPEDAKRHWRTDSVEIAVDPLGTAANTSATFKVGVFPTATDNAPHAYRDADAHQGPVSETAPGFEVASTVEEPYTGYVIETFIPFEALPAGIDPVNAALNIFIYDSDTQDRTGQTRLGWSTWNGVQGEPYRWGAMHLTGVDEQGTPVDMGATPVAVSPVVDDPVMPLDAARSTQSPQSIAQSAADGVPLGGLPPVAEGDGLTFTRTPTIANENLVLAFEAASNGTAWYFVVNDRGEVVTGDSIDVETGAVEQTISGVALGGNARVLVSFETDDGRVEAHAFELTGL